MASRTWVWTYSASSSAVTMPSCECVGRAFQAFHHVVSEDAVAASSSGLSKERSRSRLAVRENSELFRLVRVWFRFWVSSGVMAPLWQASVSRIFDLAWILPPMAAPSSSMG